MPRSVGTPLAVATRVVVATKVMTGTEQMARAVVSLARNREVRDWPSARSWDNMVLSCSVAARREATTAEMIGATRLCTSVALPMA